MAKPRTLVAALKEGATITRALRNATEGVPYRLLSPDTCRLLPLLLRFQVRLIRLLGGGFAAELEFGAGREVLDVVGVIPGAGEKLPVIDALAASGTEGQSQEGATQGVPQPNGRGGLHDG